MLAQPWKFGLGIATTMLICTMVTWRPFARTFLLPVLAIGALGLFGLYVGSRSLAGVTIVSALYVLLWQVLARREAVPSRFSPVHTTTAASLRSHSPSGCTVTSDESTPSK